MLCLVFGHVLDAIEFCVPMLLDQFDVMRLAQELLKCSERLSHDLHAATVLNDRLAQELAHARVLIADHLVRVIEPEGKLNRPDDGNDSLLLLKLLCNLKHSLKPV